LSDSAGHGTRILIADDDNLTRAVLVRAVADLGYDVLAVRDGDEAVRAFAADTFALVLSDIDMPGKSGIELLQAVRAKSLDVPVLLLTGSARLDTAIAAVDHGATRYLQKPLDVSALQDVVRRAMQVAALARARRQLALLEYGSGLQIADVSDLSARFDNAMATAVMHFQPIVRWSTRSTFGHEALVRTSEPLIQQADALFDAAERLGTTVYVARAMRDLSARSFARDGDALMFVNLNPRDLLDETLYSDDAPLASIAGSVVLEITEKVRLEEVPDIGAKVARLRDMGFRTAIDDIGAGYAGLTSFAALEPQFMKLDRALVTNIDASHTKQALVGAMIRACAELGVQVIGEGVETRAERDTLVLLGCDLFQGYLFARPAAPFAAPVFD
jgi:EAL domain-containing protein (putative c-di-GMP-specific phosphodiesterase class I)